MEKTITVAVDAMGGDNAPAAAVQGALQALENNAVRLLLVGREDAINAELNKQAFDRNRVTVLHAPEVIGTDEVPTVAVRRKKDASLMVGLRAVKDKQADAFVSAGNTGALLTGATIVIGRSPGVERPALGTMLPNKKGFTLLIDSGANVDVKPAYLAQFAVMGSAYVRRMLGIDKPRVGLINIGTEREKGNALVKEAYALLEAADVHFIGNVEAREMPAGAVDVAVCDAFVGNVVLKYTEGFAMALMDMLKEALMSDTRSKIGALLSKNAYKKFKRKFDYAEVGGAPFLGLNALVVKAHGSSDARAIAGAVRQCVLFNLDERS